MRIPRKGAIAAGSVLALMVGARLLLGPLVRARVSAIAAGRGLSAQIGGVSPGWFALTLRSLSVGSADGGAVQVWLPEVRVELGVFLRPEGVEIHGGEISLRGPTADLEATIRAWREPAAQDARRGAHKTPVEVDHVKVRWIERQGGEPRFEASDVSASRSESGWQLTVGRASARWRSVTVDVGDADVKVDPRGALVDGRVTSVAVAVARKTELPTEEAGHLPEPSPPNQPAGVSEGHGGEPPIVPAARLPLPDLRTMRAQVVAIGAIVRDHVDDGMHLEVDALSFAFGEGAQRVGIGKGPLRVSRSEAAVDVTFSTQPDASGTPLSVKATLPLEAGDAVASLSGGPISLARLGFDEGGAGLVAVDHTMVTGRGRVSLAAAGDALTFDGEAAVRGLAIDQPRIAPQIVRGIDGTAILRGVLDAKGALRLDDAELAVGAMKLLAHGTAEQTKDHLATSLTLELPSAPCESLLRSVPATLVPTLDGAEMEGTFGARGRVAFDSRKLEDLVFEWNVEDQCAMSTVPEELAKDRFAQPFEHAVYQPDGTIAEETTGPTSENWTDLEHISPFMQVAVLTTEDGAFYRHHGFNRAAMRNALVADLKAGRFARGASTITMQLAKNLFLSRDKTLSRKLEEIILADYLESSFTKHEMIELYLNVIEFGPSVYGITQAAAHYFGRTPAELNLAECLFLASVLPAPLRYGKLADRPQLSEGWTKHLRELMTIAAKLGTISEAERAEGVKEEVLFHGANDPRPEPRAPVRGTHFEATHESSDDDESADPSPPPSP